ncbi:MAG: family 16 glycoside hydrolase, partial [Planctomycetota bacterium]
MPKRFIAFCLASVLFVSQGFAHDSWEDLITTGSLDGWTKVGGDATYQIDGDVITGMTGEGKNTFLTKGPFADFELEFKVKCDAKLNSGVQFR